MFVKVSVVTLAISISLTGPIPVTAFAVREAAETLVPDPLPSVISETRAVRVTEFPAEVSVALLAIAPPTKVRLSLKLTSAETVTAPVPSAERPIVIPENPSPIAATSVAVIAKVPAPGSLAPPTSIA